jgi:hypothetical protein
MTKVEGRDRFKLLVKAVEGAARGGHLNLLQKILNVLEHSSVPEETKRKIYQTALRNAIIGRKRKTAEYLILEKGAVVDKEVTQGLVRKHGLLEFAQSLKQK